MKRCEDVLRETRYRVRVGEGLSEVFWTGKGVRQGCPLSPGLFNLLTADLEEYMRKGGWGGVRLKGERVYTLAYADDIVLLAEEEDESDDEQDGEVYKGEKTRGKCKKVEGYEIWEGRGMKKESEMELGGKGCGRGKEIQIFRVCVSE